MWNLFHMGKAPNECPQFMILALYAASPMTTHDLPRTSASGTGIASRR